MTITIGVAQAWFAIGFVSACVVLLTIAWLWGKSDADGEDSDA